MDVVHIVNRCKSDDDGLSVHHTKDASHFELLSEGDMFQNVKNISSSSSMNSCDWLYQ